MKDRTKCLEDIPADIEINTDESSLRSINIYPYSPIPSNKESYAIVLKVFNPKKSGLYQFHSYGQPKGKISFKLFRKLDYSDRLNDKLIMDN